MIPLIFPKVAQSFLRILGVFLLPPPLKTPPVKNLTRGLIEICWDVFKKDPYDPWDDSTYICLHKYGISLLGCPAGTGCKWITSPLYFGSLISSRKLRWNKPTIPKRIGHLTSMKHLVGGFNLFEKYESNWIISPTRGENEKKLKPPPRHPSDSCLFKKNTRAPGSPWNQLMIQMHDKGQPG